jgi:hypothetical protein
MKKCVGGSGVISKMQKGPWANIFQTNSQFFGVQRQSNFKEYLSGNVEYGHHFWGENGRKSIFSGEADWEVDPFPPFQGIRSAIIIGPSRIHFFGFTFAPRVQPQTKGEGGRGSHGMKEKKEVPWPQMRGLAPSNSLRFPFHSSIFPFPKCVTDWPNPKCNAKPRLGSEGFGGHGPGNCLWPPPFTPFSRYIGICVEWLKMAPFTFCWEDKMKRTHLPIFEWHKSLERKSQKKATQSVTKWPKFGIKNRKRGTIFRGKFIFVYFEKNPKNMGKNKKIFGRIKNGIERKKPFSIFCAKCKKKKCKMVGRTFYNIKMDGSRAAF